MFIFPISAEPSEYGQREHREVCTICLLVLQSIDIFCRWADVPTCPPGGAESQCHHLKSTAVFRNAEGYTHTKITSWTEWMSPLWMMNLLLKKNLKTFVCVNDVFYFNYAPSKSYQSKACQKIFFFLNDDSCWAASSLFLFPPLSVLSHLWSGRLIDFADWKWSRVHSEDVPKG